MSTLRRAFAMFGLGLALTGGTALAESGGPTIEKARGGSCVAAPEVMRRTHPELLKHQRNETVHLGMRDGRASLKACVECHASTKSGSVAAVGTDFCVSCHSYAAVKIDCFECHASRPGGTALHAIDDLRAGAAMTRLSVRRVEPADGGVTLR